jgi:mxaK protein
VKNLPLVRTLNVIAATLTLAGLATLGLGLQQRHAARTLNAAIVAAGTDQASGEASARAIGEANAQASGKSGAGAADEDPRITLARGLARARAGQHGAAQTLLQLALQRSTGALQNSARYALGNLALRQALVMGSADEHLAPTLELAKQQYRDTLLREPGDLAARYNLERALWLAPEEGLAQAGRDENTSREFNEAKSNEDTKDEKEQATTTMKNDGSSLP